MAFYLVARLVRDTHYWSHFSERLGFLAPSCRTTTYGSIWLHAVSVGEITSVRPLLAELRSAYPHRSLFVSTGTVAGRKAASKHLSSLVDGIFYVPLDYVSCVRRTLRTLQPALVVVAETEIWPNLYAEVKRSGAALAIVNGRISDRTWPTYQRLRWFFRPILALADVVAVQSETDLNRYRQMGVDRERLSCPGNLKYDADNSGGVRGPEVPTFGAEQIWVAASTVGPIRRQRRWQPNAPQQVDEDDLVLDVFRRMYEQFPRLLLILAPRQPSRFGTVARKLERSGLRFLRRSEMGTDETVALALPGVLLLDTIGELRGVFPLANVAFVGGSIVRRGGHNILEPATAGVPVIVGEHTFNFEAMVRDFRSANALLVVRDGTELLAAVRHLLADQTKAQGLASRAHRVIEQRRGASGRIIALLRPLVASAFRPPVQNRMLRPPLRVLAWAWDYGGRLKRARSLHWAKAQARIPVPVLSVGGITTGGSGKTPITKFVALGLEQRGFKPAILTRGYGRRSPIEHVIVSAGATVSSALTGDEAQIFIQSGVGPVGIGADRHQTAQRLLARHGETNLLVLDDGFQHARLPRNFDLVVIDGLDPLGGREVVPLGRLREPLRALIRADAFIVTRAEDDDLYRAVCRELQRWNQAVPVFRAQLLKQIWRECANGNPLSKLPSQRVAAFCGLGNPQNFWNTLASLGLEVVFRWEFPDHHVYKPTELSRVKQQAQLHGAELLVTTEKDRLNCPEGFEATLAPLQLAWLEIAYSVEEEQRFWSYVEERIRLRARL